MTRIEGWQAYAAGIAGLAVIVVTALPRIFGPIGRWAEDWAARRQRVARHTTAAEVRDLQTSVAALEESLADLRARAHAHSAWDRRVYTELTRAGIDVEPPPVLW